MNCIRIQNLLVAAVLSGALALAGCQTSPEDAHNKAVQESADKAAQAAKAEEAFQNSIDRPPSADTLYAMARILSVQHRDAECETLLRKIIAQFPEFIPAYNEMAELMMRQRKVDLAIESLNQGLKYTPNDGVLLNNIGMCHLLKGQNEAALNDFTKAASLAPDDTRFRANMATALGMLGRYDEALSLYLEIGTAVDAHYNLGVVAEARKDQVRADQEFALSRSLAESSEKQKKSAPAD